MRAGSQSNPVSKDDRAGVNEEARDGGRPEQPPSRWGGFGLVLKLFVQSVDEGVGGVHGSQRCSAASSRMTSCVPTTDAAFLMSLFTPLASFVLMSATIRPCCQAAYLINLITGSWVMFLRLQRLCRTRKDSALFA